MSEKEVIAISKIFQHGKCQIPKEVRELLALKDGDRLYFVQDVSGKIFLEKAPTLKKGLGKYLVTK